MNLLLLMVAGTGAKEDLGAFRGPGPYVGPNMQEAGQASACAENPAGSSVHSRKQRLQRPGLVLDSVALAGGGHQLLLCLNGGGGWRRMEWGGTYKQEHAPAKPAHA